MFSAVYDTVCQWENMGYMSAVMVTFGFQMLWYGPRFMGEVWAEAQGIEPMDASKKTDEQRQKERAQQVATGAMYLLMSFVVSYLADATGCSTINDSLWLGALLWMGFALPLAVVQHSYNPSGKKVVLLVDLTGQLMFLLAQAVCVVFFKNCQWELNLFGGAQEASE